MFHGLTMVNFDGQTQNQMMVRPWSAMVDHGLMVRLSQGLDSLILQSVSWILAEFYVNRGLQRLYTGTCIILQKTINGFLCLLIVFLKSKTYQLILKDVIKLNRNLR